MDEDASGRRESAAKRMDRHWNEMLQELRVTQTGVQILFAFLLILPFQVGFAELSDASRNLYVAVVCLVTTSTILNLAPVITHRFLYQRHRRDALMRVSDILARTSFVTLGLALLGAVLLAVDMVLGRGPALVIIGVFALLIVVLWVVVPKVILARSDGGGYRRD